MTKAFVDVLLSNMKKAGIVTKASPWGVEGMGDRELNVRYVGIRLTDWDGIISSQNNLLIKFVTSRNESFFEFYLANKPPFVRILRKNFTGADKWETLLGEIKNKLHKDKQEFVHHKEKVGNLYVIIVSHLKTVE